MKAKKVLAMLMASAMILGSTVTAFAANDTTTIKVSGLATTGTNAATYVKILEPDVTAETGYKFAEGVSIHGYTTVKAFLDAGTEAQKAALLHEDTVLPEATPGTTANNEFTATVDAGYYMVSIINTPSSEGTQVVYTNPMIVSVEYDEATKTADGYDYNVKENDTDNEVVAKYTTLPTVKTGNDKTEGSEDEVVEIGGTATYKIETYVPSEVTNYKIIDELTDASYQQGTVKVSIETVGDITDQLSGKITFADKEDGTLDEGVDESMTIDLSQWLTGYAGKKVTITYDVTVTGTKVENTVVPEDGKHNYGEATEELYTGAIKFTKYGEDGPDVGEENDPLPGAIFNVEDEDGNLLKFTLNEEDNVYYLDPTNGIENVTSGADGTFTLYGLNLGTYNVIEIQAPEGYSVNTKSEKVTITEANTTKSETLDPADGDMTDTKLASLPSTGGIGTTIFTIGGCVIMVTAAGLYFATRKKEQN